MAPGEQCIARCIGYGQFQCIICDLRICSITCCLHIIQLHHLELMKVGDLDGRLGCAVNDKELAGLLTIPIRYRCNSAVCSDLEGKDAVTIRSWQSKTIWCCCLVKGISTPYHQLAISCSIQCYMGRSSGACCVCRLNVVVNNLVCIHLVALVQAKLRSCKGCIAGAAFVVFDDVDGDGLICHHHLALYSSAGGSGNRIHITGATCNA